MANLNKSKLLKQLAMCCQQPRLLFSTGDANDNIVRQIPQSWWPLLTLGEIDRDLLIKLWQPASANLPMTLVELTERLHGLAVLEETNDLPSLLYIFVTDDGHVYFYKGRIPIDAGQIPKRLQEAWQLAPEEFHKLYSIHNGWYQFPALSNGFFPVEQWRRLSSREWGLDAETIGLLPFDIDRTLFTHYDGGSGYLGLEFPPDDRKGRTRTVRWWTNDTAASAANIRLWEELDSAISARLHDFVPFAEAL